MPRCRHKVMHRKRVTCELRDNYFRSMSIKHAIPGTAEVHIPMISYGKRSRRRAWLTIWDKVKMPLCRHKVMHRKRVTCELRDNYFRSMTIKHAIPKTAEVHILMGSYRKRSRGRGCVSISPRGSLMVI